MCLSFIEFAIFLVPHLPTSVGDKNEQQRIAELNMQSFICAKNI